MREGAIFDSSRRFNPKDTALEMSFLDPIDKESNDRMNAANDINAAKQANLSVSDKLNRSRSDEIDNEDKSSSKLKLGTPEMMAASMALQLLDEKMAAPYKEMAVKQAGEENRRAKQENALVNLQNISKMYGNL